MIRTLYIVRHAKAEDRSLMGRDHDRELVQAGIQAAARMGKHFAEKGLKPDQLVSSTAARALKTAEVIAEQLGIDPATIEQNATLFDGGPKAYMAAVNALPDNVATAMIFGHNPDVSYFAEYLTHQSVGSMSKGAVAVVQFENISWAEVSGRTGQLVDHISPKQLD